MLERLITGLIVFAVILRPFGPGVPLLAPENSIFSILVWAAAAIWAGNGLLYKGFNLPRIACAATLAAFVALLYLSAHRTIGDGNSAKAFDMLEMWLSNIILFIVAADHFANKLRFRILLSVIVAGAVMVSAYGLYQRAYGQEYFRKTIRSDEAKIESMVGRQEVMKNLFRSRLDSNRITGPFGYPNSLAAFLLVVAAPLSGLALLSKRSAVNSRILAVMIFALMAALIMSGSKAGFICAKLLELATFALLAKRDSSSFKQYSIIALGIVFCTAISAAVAAGVYWLTESLFAFQVIFVLLWAGEVCLFSNWKKPPYFIPYIFKFGGGVILLTGIISGIYLFGIMTDPGSNSNSIKRLAWKAREAAIMTIEVRANYWRGAVGMVKDYPIRGVGLDNFGSRYTQYKPLRGWITKKAHNIYLQLAADGGLPLAVSFIAFWGLIISPGFRAIKCDNNRNIPYVNEKRIDLNEQIDLSRLRMGIAVAGILAFFVTYYLYLHGLFMGLSFEYITHGLHAASKGEMDYWPVLFNAAIHLAVLPATWIAGFFFTWEALKNIDAKALRPWLLFGLCAVLLHATADFHLANSVVNSHLWLAAALLFAGNAKDSPKRLQLNPILAPVAIIAIGIAIWLYPMKRLSAAIAVQNAFNVEQTFRIRQNEDNTEFLFDAAVRAQETAIAARPDDPEPKTTLALLLAQKYFAISHRNSYSVRASLTELRDKIAALLEGSVRLDPYNSGHKATLAGHLFHLYPNNRERLEEATQQMEAAISLHPYKPVFRVMLGEMLIAVGRLDDARRMLREALSINKKVYDERAFLSAEEKQKAESLLGILGE